MNTPEICIIYNPSAGRGRAAGRLSRLRRVLGAKADFRPTNAPGMAADLALQAGREGFPIVAAAGGDGTVHEVGNGLLRSGRTDVVFAVLPIGSANDYAYTLGLAADWWLRPDPAISPRPLDVGVVRSAGRELYFLNGLGLGLNGAVTLESRKIQRLQGIALYGVALFRALLFHFKAVPMMVQLDDARRDQPTLALTLALGQREGNFVVAPHASLEDGLFEYLHVGALQRRQLPSLVLALFRGKLPADHPNLRQGRCRRAIVRSTEPLTVHIDGEFFCRPEEGIREIAVECLPGRLLVFARAPR